MNALCTIRDIYRSIRVFEELFQQKHDLCLNEGMLLCSLMKAKKLTSTGLSEALALTASNTSKVIKSVEKKGYVERILGKEDKRMMYFVLNERGMEKLSSIRDEEPEILNLIFQIEGLAQQTEKATV